MLGLKLLLNIILYTLSFVLIAFSLIGLSTLISSYIEKVKPEKSWVLRKLFYDTSKWPPTVIVILGLFSFYIIINSIAYEIFDGALGVLLGTTIFCIILVREHKSVSENEGRKATDLLKWSRDFCLTEIYQIIKGSNFRFTFRKKPRNLDEAKSILWEHVLKDEKLMSLCNNHNVSQADLEYHLKNLLDACKSCWVNGHFVPLASFAYPESLEKILQHPKNNSDYTSLINELHTFFKVAQN